MRNYSQDYSYDCVKKILFSYFSTKTYVVGTQKNCLNETVLLSTNNICLNWWVRKYLQFYGEIFVYLNLWLTISGIQKRGYLKITFLVSRPKHILNQNICCGYSRTSQHPNFCSSWVVFKLFFCLYIWSSIAGKSSWKNKTERRRKRSAEEETRGRATEGGRGEKQTQDKKSQQKQITKS